jgi:hypothetical protein
MKVVSRTPLLPIQFGTETYRQKLQEILNDHGQALNEAAVAMNGWRDEIMPIVTAPVGVVAPTLTNFGPAGSLQRKEYAFAVGDYVWLPPFHINHGVKIGGRAYAHVHWSTSSTSTAVVKWELNIDRALGHNQANFAGPTAYYVSGAAQGTAWRHMISEVADASALTLTEPDELILVSLRRVTNGGVDNANTVFALMVDLHYEVDRVATAQKAPPFW